MALSQFDTLEAATAKRVSAAAVAATAAMVCTYEPPRQCLVNQADQRDYKLTMADSFFIHLLSFIHLYIYIIIYIIIYI